MLRGRGRGASVPITRGRGRGRGGMLPVTSQGVGAVGSQGKSILYWFALGLLN